MRFLALFVFIFCVSATQANKLYFLCGPDEDGCFDDDYTSCACLPQDAEPGMPHCLDFNELRCIPLSQTAHCNPLYVFKTQGDCLASMFHSTQTTPCHLKPRSFCIQNHIQFCDYNANNCHSAVYPKSNII